MDSKKVEIIDILGKLEESGEITLTRGSDEEFFI